MASPNPVPSILLFLSSSTLSNLKNILSKSSLFIPLPVSSTEIEILEILLSLIASTLSVILPESVYFTALVRILIIHFFKFA